MPYALTCQQCQSVFVDSHKSRKFCSRECSDKGRKQEYKPMETVDCLGCGKPFERPARWKSKSNHKNYCTLKCYNRSRRDARGSLKCKNCGAEFRVNPGNRARRYCSQTCYIEYKKAHRPYHLHKGDMSLYGLNWYEQRDKRRQIDNYCCQNCGTHERDLEKQLHAHHVKPFREFGIERYEEANQLDNLVSLCSLCHKRLEHSPDLCWFLAIRNIY